MQVTITNKNSGNLTAQIFGGTPNGTKTNAINPFNIKSITITMRANKLKPIEEYKNKIVDIAFLLTELEYGINKFRVEKHELVTHQNYEKAVVVKKKEDKLLRQRDELLLTMRICVSEIQNIESMSAEKEIKKLKKQHSIKSKPSIISLSLNIRDVDGMSVGLMNSLLYNEMNTIGEILKFSADDFSKRRRFGKKMIAELQKYLAKYNLKLKA